MKSKPVWFEVDEVKMNKVVNLYFNWGPKYPNRIEAIYNCLTLNEDLRNVGNIGQSSGYQTRNKMVWMREGNNIIVISLLY